MIKKHGNLLNNYSKQLQAEGVVTQQEVDDVIQRYEKICEDAFKKAQEEKQVYHKHWLDSPWSGMAINSIFFLFCIFTSREAAGHGLA